MKVATGQMKSTALYAIAPAKAKRMKVRFSRDAMEAFELDRQASDPLKRKPPCAQQGETQRPDSLIQIADRPASRSP